MAAAVYSKQQEDLKLPEEARQKKFGEGGVGDHLQLIGDKTTSGLVELGKITKVYGDDYATRSENSAARRLLRRDSFAIARAHCWLVSGTPLRSRFDDLSHLLALLDSKVWSGDLISHVSSRYSANDPEGSEALDLSRRVIKTVMWRATKELTDAEAVLPPVRYVADDTGWMHRICHHGAHRRSPHLAK